VSAFSGARGTGQRRPGYAADQRRRRAVVSAHLHEHGHQVEHGVWQARCAVCGQVKTLRISDWWADHVDPVAAGGREQGELRLSCKACQIQQGSQVGNARNPRAQSRKRAPEPHPGAISPEKR